MKTVVTTSLSMCSVQTSSQRSYRSWKILELKSHIFRPGKSWNQA